MTMVYPLFEPMLAAFSGCLAVGLALYGFALLADHRRLRRRVEVLGSEYRLETGEPLDVVLDQHARSGSLRWMRPLTEQVAGRLPAEMRQSLRARLAQAGLLGKLNEAEFVALRLLAGGLALGVGTVFGVWLTTQGSSLALIGGALAGVGLALLPDNWVQAQIHDRQRAVRRVLPDALDLLVVSVEAGTGFDAAMARVGEKLKGPLAQEFNRALQEMRLGKTRAAALRAMAERVGVEELGTFVSAVCQADQLGASMARVLTVQAETLRQRQVYRTREMAMKLPVKLMFPLILCIFPAILVVILGPGLITVYETLLR